MLNLEGLDVEQQMRCAAAFLGGLFDADRDHWYPVLVVVDEAQLFAPAVAGEVSDEARKLSLGAMTNLMCRGRKRGLAGVIATQRLAKLAKNVAAEASNFLMGRTFLDIDMARAADLLGMDRRQSEAFRDLPAAISSRWGRPCRAGRCPSPSARSKTSARSTSPKLTPRARRAGAGGCARPHLHALAGEARPMAVRRPPPPPPVSTADILTQLANARPGEAEEPAEPMLPVIAEAEHAAMIDEVLREILADPDAAFRTVAVLYQDFLVRCRIRRVPGEPLTLADFAAASPWPGPAST